MNDLMAQFAQMQKYTAALHSLISSAQAYAPSESEGADRTGTVRVVLGPDGLPESFRVDSDWERRLEPAEFTGAVVDAFQAAVSDRMRAWTEAMAEDGWQDRVDRLRGGIDAAPETRIPAAFRKPVEPVRPREIGAITEDVLKAFDNVGTFAKPPGGESASGTDRTHELTITLSSSALTSVSADVDWVAQQTAARLMNALGEALAEARSELAEAAEQPKPTSGLDHLLAEAMAILNDPSKFAD